jgi:hypothetical protein
LDGNASGLMATSNTDDKVRELCKKGGVGAEQASVWIRWLQLSAMAAHQCVMNLCWTALELIES